MRRLTLPMLAIAAVLLTAAGAVDQEPGAGEIAEERQIPRFDLKDVHGKLVSAQQLDGWIMIYGFGNEDNADKSLETLKKLTAAEPAAEGVIYVCVADTTKHNSKILRPFVMKILKREYGKQIDQVREILDEKGAEYNFEIEKRYLLIADMQADIFRLFDIEDDRDRPHIFILDGDHRVRGHYNEHSEEMESTLRNLIAEREAEDQYALKVKKKKRGWWKYVLVGGAVLWYVME